MQFFINLLLVNNTIMFIEKMLIKCDIVFLFLPCFLLICSCYNCFLLVILCYLLFMKYSKMKKI